VRVEIKFFDPTLKRITAKATFYVKTDVKGRRLGKWIGLDTLVMWADNDECHIQELFFVYKWKCKHSTSRVIWQHRNWNH